MLRFLFWLLLLCPAYAFGQHIIPRFNTIGVEDGLSQSSVYSIYQDRKGFMWFGTADGLNRYDGSEIHVFKVDPRHVQQGNSNFIRGNIAEDKRGNIWYSNETGIYYYSPVADEIIPAYQFSKEEGETYVFEMIGFDSRGTLWLLNPVKGVTEFNPATRTLQIHAFPSRIHFDRKNYSECEIDQDDQLWILLSVAQGIVNFDTRLKDYRLPAFDKPVHRRIEANGSVYALSYTGTNYRSPELRIYDRNDRMQQTIPLPGLNVSDMTVVKIFVDFLGRIWLTTMNAGLLMYDPAKQKLQSFVHDNARVKSLPLNFTRVLFEDAQHNLWIGTDGAGVSKLDLKPPKFNLFPLNEGDYPFLKDYFIKCFYEDATGHIWFGTLSNGICRLDPKTGELDTVGSAAVKPGKFSTAVTGCIFEDSKGRIWAGSSMGIGIYNPRRHDFDPIELANGFSLQPFNIFVYQIIELGDGSYLAATSHGVVHIVPNGNSYIALLKNEAMMRFGQATSVQRIGNDIWFTSPINGLFHLRYNAGSFTFIEKLFTNTDLRGISIDQQDGSILWVASGIGLIRLNTISKQYQVLGSSQGLRNSYVYGVLEDEAHHLWMSTNGGIAMFDKQSQSFSTYTNKDGLQSNEFNTGAYYRSRAGVLYFGGIKGFNWFKPSSFVLTSSSPRVAIAQLSVNEKPLINDSAYYFNQTLRLSYDHNDISLTIAALDFTKPEANKIAYQLRGWENSPVVTYSKQIHYSNIAPGSYTLTVRACNAAGVWSEPITLSIVITPPFWNTWWFYALLATAVITAIMLLARFIYQNELKERIKELEKEKAIEAERLRISREMHDDIGAGLTQIALMSEVARHNTTNQKELEDIAGTSRKLMNNMSEIIWSLNAEYKTLELLFHYLREQLHRLLEPSGIDYQIRFPEEVPDIVLTNDQRRNILLVVKEAVHNAVKHSGAAHISIRADIAGDLMCIEIKDNGKGFEVAAKRDGNGLKNLQHRCTMLHAELQLQTAPGNGVHFIFSIPLNSHS